MGPAALVEAQLYTVYMFWVVNYDGNKAEHMQTWQGGAMVLAFGTYPAICFKKF